MAGLEYWNFGMDQKSLSTLLLCLNKNTKCLDVQASLCSLREEDGQSLINLSGKLGIKSSFYYRLKACRLSEVLLNSQVEELRKAYLSNAVRFIIHQNELAKIAKQFQLSGLSLIILKGAFLATFVYEDPAMREMSDIDLLVRTSELGQAAKELELLGYKAEKPYNIDDVTTVAHHLPPFIKPGKGVIELHWNIISLVGNEPVDEEGLWERALPYEINGISVLGLCPEDLLLHICGHASYHHKFEVGLRALVDIVEIMDHYGDQFNWNRFLQRARAWHWDRGTYLVLRLAKEMLGARVPDEVLKSLRPGGFKEYFFDIASAQMLSDDPLIGKITYPLADWHVASIKRKFSIFWQRLFLPKPVLADRFSVTSKSPLIYFYYPIRLFDLLIRYIGLIIKLWHGEKSTAPFVERKGALQDWLHEKE